VSVTYSVDMACPGDCSRPVFLNRRDAARYRAARDSPGINN